MTHPSHPSLAWIDSELEALSRASLARRLLLREGSQGPRIVLAGRPMVNFGSNDYLSLAGDPRLTAAVAAALADEGWGGGASPLISGFGQWHERLQERIARLEGTEAALVFPSGFAANAGTVAALAGPGDAVFTDRKNHASLLDGCRLARADVRVYPHGSLDALARLLARTSARRRLVVTDALFSMDGECAPLSDLVELADRHGAMLLVDEAHATGVFGPHGRGVCEAMGVEERVPVRVGTLSKALGSVGGFVAGSAALVRWLIHRARPYVFSTAAPGAIHAASIAALDIVESEPQRRAELLRRAAELRAGLVRQGWNVGASSSQILPLIVGEPARAMALARRLGEAGFFVPAIRPPTVPKGESCLRISLTFGHTEAMVDGLLDALGVADG